MADRDDAWMLLPRGTVTLLFADVEGSTRLLHTLGPRYGEVRTRAREIIRDASSRNSGHEVDWAGDGAFLAFERAGDAVVAAATIQRALGAEQWPPESAVRMRVGVHTGEPTLGAEGYVGIDVHVAARICSAAHGGQVVVSRTTRDFVADAAPPETTFRPLGSHRLKDVGTSHQLFQVVAPGLDEDFPPLQTLGGATLPALHHRLVGRSDTLAEIGSLLGRKDIRLVTISGPGGAGKSRLALEVAGVAALERPVHLVALAPLSDPELVPAAIARTVGAREAGGRSLIDQIAETLAGTRTLLVLDNLEHLPAAVVHVRALLDLVPDLDVLTTSRTPLHLLGERVISLDPLPMADAATLFAELAAARGVVLRPDALSSVHEICRRLDGLPLAIELVAARLVVLPPAQILEALDDGLALEMEGPIDLPERQRTLRATIDWSYGLLTESQRELHGVLGVFAGGCSLEDARAIAGSPVGFLGDLEALVGWSLVRSDVSDGDVRLSMLETVREHVVARQASAGMLDDRRQRHGERFLELAFGADDRLTGPDQAECLERLERDLDNIRATLDWCFGAGRIEDALRAVSALERFWRAHGHVSEARRWLALGLGLAGDVPADVRADALWTAAQQATAQYDWSAAVALLEEALELFRESGRGREMVFALSDLGFVALVQDDLERAAALCEEALSLARELGDPRAISAALGNLGDVRSVQEDHDRALEHREESLKLRRALGDPLLVADATYHLGVAAFWADDLLLARNACAESLELARELGETPHMAAALFVLAELDLFAEDLGRAEATIRESLGLYTELENDRACTSCLVILSAIACARSSFDEAARLIGAAEALRGDSPLNRHERAVLERFEVELDRALQEDALVGLKAEGARLGTSVAGNLVSASTQE